MPRRHTSTPRRGKLSSSTKLAPRPRPGVLHQHPSVGVSKLNFYDSRLGMEPEVQAIKEEKRQECTNSQCTQVKSLFHEDRFNKYTKFREVLIESRILIDTNELSPISEQINKRKWQRLTKPIQAVGYTMMREFYANAWVMESERHLRLPYTSIIRGKKIKFSPGEIHKVLNHRTKPLPNVTSYHDRKNENDLRMKDILRDL
ncbi:hypothetical protein PIB30_061655 [Stylosanthes scabra]|uniref:Uncharacterized protein n=1 Tax=Stylosanthes scabra TaxID=79078 RepID=A0ABU6RLT4_9FABA|nr:hypothetical protein [Stylosanthes scabra]